MKLDETSTILMSAEQALLPPKQGRLKCKDSVVNLRTIN